MKKIGHLSWLMLTLFYILLISIDHSNAASNHGLDEELRFIHQEIGLLRNENHHQNMEIALLKERIDNTEDSDDQRIIADSRLPGNHFRNKRPVRLLPPHILYGERKNETELQKQMNRRRYEQPTNCSDLSLLGYTLNGLYTVKSNESSTKSNSTNNETKLETVYCAFKQPEGKFNSTLVEKRIISRREITKPSSKIIFHATRKTDLPFMLGNKGQTKITFENVRPNSGDAFNPEDGTFIIPQSGVYLFIFRGNVTFPTESFDREFHILFSANFRIRQSGRKDAKIIGTHTVHQIGSTGKFAYVEFDKMFNVKQGDKVQVDARSGKEFSATFSSSTSFSAYLLNE